MVNRHVGTSGQCPICTLQAEDAMHLLFQSPAAQELWESIGIRGIIEEAILEDLSGSVVLESLLMRQDNNLPAIASIGLKETIIFGCWYLWWMRRHRTHNESVPPIYICRMSILSIMANVAKASITPAEQCWTKPEV
jgi:hypothetical protein